MMDNDTISTMRGKGTVCKHYWWPGHGGGPVRLRPSGDGPRPESQRHLCLRSVSPDAAHGPGAGRRASGPVAVSGEPETPAAAPSEPTARSGDEEPAPADGGAEPVPATTATAGATVPASEIDIQPGQCWVYAQIQPRPVQESVEVKVRDSEVRLEVTPAEFRRGIKEVVTKEGTRTYRVRPATYKEVTEQVLVKPETTRLVVEPAVYEDVEEEVVLEEARTELKPCRTSARRPTPATRRRLVSAPWRFRPGPRRSR